MRGLNRGACACIVFLMREGVQPEAKGLSLREAIDWVSRRRARILANEGFLLQLAVHGHPGTEAKGYVMDLVTRVVLRDSSCKETK